MKTFAIGLLSISLVSLSLSGCMSITHKTPSTAATAENSAASQATPSRAMPHVKRPNLVVKDLARSIAIYQDVLGLSANPISVSGEDSFSYPVFNIPRDAQIRGVTFDSPREKRVLALTELASLDLERPHDAPFMSTVVIGVTDLAGKFEQLKAMGLSVTETRIAGGAEFKFIEQAFVDPDGHLIVCYEILT